MKLKQKLKEFTCFLFGHRWDSEFGAYREIDKPIEKRTYCTRCGIRYHKHEYKK